MKTFVEFRSNKFPPVKGEEEEINPGIWGKRLADFLREGLRIDGFETSEPVSEDWGWVIPVMNKEFNLWIGCSNYQEYPDGFLCFIEPNKPFIRKFFKKIETSSRVLALQKAMDNIFEKEPSIRDKRWWTAEEFQNPKSRDAQSQSLYPITSEDERMRFAIDEARRTLQKFFETYGNPKPNQTSFLLKVLFESGDIREHIWMADLDVSKSPLEGTIANKTNFPDLAFMQRVTFHPSQITDWMYLEDGYLVGGYTTQVIRAGLSAEERAEYDARAPFKFR